MDSVLLPYLRSTEQTERKQLLSDLILVHASPLVRLMLRRRLGFHVNQFGVNPYNQDAEDLYHEVVVKLIAVLSDPKLAAGQNVIRNFRQYVLGLAGNACHDYLRAKSPSRNRLKNNLRDLMERHRDFAVWRSEGGKTLCGLAVWKDRAVVSARRVAELIERPDALLAAKFSHLNVKESPLTKIAAEVFNWLESSTELDDLVGIVAVLLDVKDLPYESLNDHDNKHWVEAIADTDLRSGSEVEARELLRLLWDAVRRLPVKQRDAFCLRFADESGDDLFTLLVAAEIVSFKQLSEELGRSHDELMRLWQHMPMDNATIAVELGATRQQVIKWCFRAQRRLEKELLPSLVGK